jgi:hypothetical protein
MNTATIRIRRGTTAQWLASNRVLQNGEPGWDTQAKLFYIGDGETPFPGLTPINGPGGGGGSAPTNLSVTRTTTTVTVESDTGTDAVLPAADANAGVMTAAMKTKLDGVATGATANSSDASLKDRANHTGTQAISTISGLQTALNSKGTSNLQLGTTSTTALRGDVTADDIGGVVGTGVTNIVALSQTAYDNLSPHDPTTLYVIV